MTIHIPTPHPMINDYEPRLNRHFLWVFAMVSAMDLRPRFIPSDVALRRRGTAVRATCGGQGELVFGWLLGG